MSDRLRDKVYEATEYLKLSATRPFNEQPDAPPSANNDFYAARATAVGALLEMASYFSGALPVLETKKEKK